MWAISYGCSSIAYEFTFLIRKSMGKKCVFTLVHNLKKNENGLISFSDATFLAILTATSYIPNIANTIIVFSGTPINPGNHYIRTGTDKGKYCVPYTGVYEFNVQFKGNN